PGRKVILFSSDNDFVVRCDGMPNLIGLFVSYPDKLGSNHCTQWENVSRLLYQLSVIYGRVDVNTPVGETVRMYGVWRGKGVSHWREEAGEITVDAPSSVLLESVRRDATILGEAEGSEAS
ncbi:MAG: hypothetical protein N2651_00260, partial [Fimbriimonadales bacterium]|nr:hypothetical protein [Fimbriimonadales bacterium]